LVDFICLFLVSRQTSDPRSGFATVEKDVPGSLTPMLGDKKVSFLVAWASLLLLLMGKQEWVKSNSKLSVTSMLLFASSVISFWVVGCLGLL